MKKILFWACMLVGSWHCGEASPVYVEFGCGEVVHKIEIAESSLPVTTGAIAGVIWLLYGQKLLDTRVNCFGGASLEQILSACIELLAGAKS